MSETVHYKGFLSECIPFDGHTIQEAAKQIYDERGYTMSDYWKERFDGNWAKELASETDDYVYYKDRLFKVIKKKELDPDAEIARASNNIDGTINYEVRYYNGGAGFGEMIQAALKKLGI